MTREYAIRWLSKKLKVSRQNAEDCETEWFATKSMYHTAVAVYEMAISALREQPRWISVEEALPEDYLWVQVYRAANQTMDTDFRTPSRKSGWCHYSDITHWMHLPEPPTEEEV